MAEQPRSVPATVGEQLTPEVQSVTPVSLFAYSAATWMAHRIHYDTPYTVGTEGYKGLLIHGPLQGTWLAQIATRWAEARGGRLRKIGYQNRASAYMGERLTVKGQVTAEESTAEGRQAQLELWIENEEGQRTTVGTATVLFH